MSKQNYISDKLTHFIGRKLTNQNSKYDLLVKILNDKQLSPPPHVNGLGSAVKMSPKNKISDNDLYQPYMICFCDIPDNNLKIHTEKYSCFGISFSKNFIVNNGGRPVFYIPKNSEIANRFDNIFKKHERIFTNIPSVTDIDLFQFFSYDIFGYIVFYDHNLPDEHPENYYFEREWRIIGSLNFTLKDIKSIYIPRKYFDNFYSLFPELSNCLYSI